ncbi:MAG: hypothetical protein GY827_02215 [Cytophagales bacterium]|nr:hypothetical protein [Cytophagales bacterium]
MLRFYCLLLTFGLLFTFQQASAQKKKLANSPSVRKKSEIKTERFFIEAEKFFLQEDYIKALEYFTKAQQHNKKSPAIFYKIAHCNYKLKNYEVTLKNIKKAVKYSPKETYYYQLWAQTCLALQEKEQAVAVYQQLIENTAKPKYEYLDLADICERIIEEGVNKHRELQDPKELKKVEEKVKAYTYLAVDAYKKFEYIDGDNIDLALQQQKLLLLVRDVKEALRVGDKFLKKNPANTSMILSQAKILYDRQKVKPAIGLLEQKHRDYPKNKEITLTLVEFYNANQQEVKAHKLLYQLFDNTTISLDEKVNIISFYLQRPSYKDFEKIAYDLGDKLQKLHPTKTRPYILIGDINSIYDQAEGAKIAYSKAVEIDPTLVEVWKRVIAFHENLQESDSVIYYCSKALEHNPENFEIWFKKGSVEAEKSDFKNAIISFNKGVENSQDETRLLSIAYPQLAYFYSETKEFDKSFEMYDKALVLTPNNPLLLNNYAYVLATNEGNLSKAESMSKKSLRMEPYNPLFLDTFGWILYLKKDYTGAVEQFKKAVNISDNSVIIEHYGDVLFRLNKVDEAVEQWKIAQQKGGASEFIDKKIQDKKIYE